MSFHRPALDLEDNDVGTLHVMSLHLFYYFTEFDGFYRALSNLELFLFNFVYDTVQHEWLKNIALLNVKHNPGF